MQKGDVFLCPVYSIASTPKQIVLRLRHPQGKPIRKVTVNGKDHKNFDATDGTIRIEPANKTIRVKAEY